MSATVIPFPHPALPPAPTLVAPQDEDRTNVVVLPAIRIDRHEPSYFDDQDDCA